MKTESKAARIETRVSAEQKELTISTDSYTITSCTTWAGRLSVMVCGRELYG